MKTLCISLSLQNYFLLNRQQMIFYENQFYQNNQAQICSEAFQFPENVACEETMTLPNGKDH